MKKLLFLLCCIGTLATNASHLMGGQITARQINGLQYEITLTLYRDIMGVNVASAIINITSTDSALVYNVTRTLTQPTSLLLPNGVEEHVFIDTLTLPAATTYKLVYNTCCRNGSILNMTQSGSEGLYLKSDLDASGLNSTPYFLNKPITTAQINSLLIYNPLPFDADGDSLAWSLVTPLSHNGAVVAGYVLPSADTAQLFTMDNLTGQISWIPNLLGNFVVSILVEEFRAGAKIGEIRRDMQIQVVAPVNNPNKMVFQNQNWPLNAKGYYEFMVAFGNPLNIVLNVKDDDNDSVRVDAVGEVFMKGAGYSSTYGITNASGTISWTPTLADARTMPYLGVFRGSEFHNGIAFYNDLTFLVKVINNTSVETLQQDFANIYPNPVTAGQTLTLPIVMENAGFAQISLINNLGQTVEVLYNAKLPQGQNVLMHQLNKVAPGVYIIKLETGLVTKTQTLIVE